MIATYCVGCHNAKLKTANLVLEGLSLEKIAENAAVWEKVVRKLNGGQMPPQGVPKPPAAQTQALAQELPAGMAAIPLNPGIINTEMLRSCFGGGASAYPKPAEWAKRAGPFILALSAKDNGRSVDAPS